MGASEILVLATSSAANSALDRSRGAATTIAVRSLGAVAGTRLNKGSRMRRESLVRFCERAGVRLPCATHLVVLCRSLEEAAAVLAVVQEWTAAAGLLLHPAKTRLVNAPTQGFDFLGYHFVNGRHRPRSKSLQKLKDTVRAKTKRTSRDTACP